MADKEIGIVIKAKDEASKAMGDISSKMSGHFQAMSGAAAIAGGAIVAFLGSTLSGAGEAEEAQKQLEHAVLNVSHATQEQLQSTMDLADVLERKGVLDGDNIKVGLAQLSTFGLSNDAVQALGGSMADLAVNQFGVSASGDQLSQSANTIAKALNGQFGVLEKSGIRFTEAQKAIIKTGTEMEKVKAINEGLSQNLKYTNDVALTTFAGGMAHLNVQLDNVKEAIGTALFPILQGLVGKILPITNAITGWVSANPALFQTIVEITAVVAVLMTGLGVLGFILPSITGAVGALAAMFALVFSPVGLLIAGVAALTAGLVYLYTTNEEVRNKVNEAWGAMVAFIMPIVQTMQTTIINFITTVKTAWVEDWGGVRTFFMEVWTFLSTTGLQFVKQVFMDIQLGMGNLTKFIREHWTTIKTIWDTTMTAIQLAWGLFWNQIKLVFSVQWELLKGLIKVGMDVLKGNWGEAWQHIKEMFTNIWNDIKIFLGDTITTIQTALTGAWESIGSAVTGFGATLQGIWNGIWDGIKKKVDDVVASIKRVIDGMIGAINSAISGVGNLGNAALNIATFGLAGKRAMGGMVSGGGAYLVGEQGPEIFVPNQGGNIIPNSRTGGGGGGITVVNNFAGATFLGSPEDVGDSILKIFRLQTRL